jgi:hypothetical protein
VGWWHSLDGARLAAALAARAPGARVLLEVNVAGEPQKGGCDPAAVPGLTEHCRELGLDVRGLMTVAPVTGDPRRWFGRLRELAADEDLSELSMGMSGDFEAAVAEGATLIRLGTVLFGARPAVREAVDPGR